MVLSPPYRLTVTPDRPPSVDALARELAGVGLPHPLLVDAARAAIAAGDPGAALRALARHEREFSGAALAPESAVLRIEALLASGDRVGAALDARRFLRLHPGSAHAAHVRTLLAVATRTTAP